jgi:hypothetical protein
MPNNEQNFLSPGSIVPYIPKTTTLPTHSFEDRLMTAEFDDALCDQAPWKNPRYDGSKMIGKKINEYNGANTYINNSLTSSGETIGQYIYADTAATASERVWGGDVSYDQFPVITNQTTALYIANTIVGGTENPKYATIKDHSYVGISKILLIDPHNNTVQILDSTTEPYEEFHRFITNDFPTGERVKVKILSEEAGNLVPNNLSAYHRVKMNKGYLWKTFSFKHAGEFHTPPHLTGSDSVPELNSYWDSVNVENNTMYLYKGGQNRDNFFHTGSAGSSPGSLTVTNYDDQLRFRFANHEIYSFSNPTCTGCGPSWNIRQSGPSFASSSIHHNMFTSIYYTGSYGFINDAPTGSTNGDILASSGLGSASRFLAVDTLYYLRKNIENTELTEQEKTEVHVTFFEGTKDFAPGLYDERSISTFEIDQQQGQLSVEQGDHCNGGIPTTHELVFKGRYDTRFLPTTHTYNDSIQSAHLQSTASSGIGGCVAPGTGAVTPADDMEPGVNIDRLLDAKVYVQGGALGPVGYEGAITASAANYPNTQADNMQSDNYYSGSFSYEVSFLEKQHVLILDLHKDNELENGIGDLGLLLIPNHLYPSVAFNLNYWLSQAGVIPSVGDNTPNENQVLPGNIDPTGLF